MATHFAELNKLKRRYHGDIKRLLQIKQLCHLYQITAYNLPRAQECYIKNKIQKHIPSPYVSLGNSVLVCGNAHKQFRPWYKDYRITKCLGNARAQVSDNHGKLSVCHVIDVMQITPFNHEVQHIPYCTGMGCHCILTVNPNVITDLQWHATDSMLLDN